MHDNQADSPKFSITNEGPPAKPLAELFQGTMAHKTDKHATNRIKDVGGVSFTKEEPPPVNQRMSAANVAAVLGVNQRTITRNLGTLSIAGVRIWELGFEKKKVIFHADDLDKIKKAYGM